MNHLINVSLTNIRLNRICADRLLTHVVTFLRQILLITINGFANNISGMLIKAKVTSTFCKIN